MQQLRAVCAWFLGSIIVFALIACVEPNYGNGPGYTPPGGPGGIGVATPTPTPGIWLPPGGFKFPTPTPQIWFPPGAIKTPVGVMPTATPMFTLSPGVLKTPVGGLIYKPGVIVTPANTPAKTPIVLDPQIRPRWR